MTTYQSNYTGAQIDSAIGAVADKYTKPSSGIPKTDLASDVQTSLGKADGSVQKSTQNINALDYGFVGNGTPEDTAILNELLNHSYRTVYLPNGTYNIGNTSINILKKAANFICDGTISYSGNDSAIIIGNAQNDVTVRTIIAENGNGIEISGDYGSAIRARVNIKNISAGNIGVKLYTSVEGSSVSYCQINVQYINAGAIGICVDCDETTAETTWLTECHYWIGVINRANIGIKLTRCAAHVFHSLALEHLGNDIGIYLEDTGHNLFYRMRFTMGENLNLQHNYTFKGSCDNNYFITGDYATQLQYIKYDELTGGSNNDFIGCSLTGYSQTEFNARVNYLTGLSFDTDKTLCDIGIHSTNFPNFVIGLMRNSTYRCDIPQGVVFNNVEAGGQTVTISAVYSDFGRSLNAGYPLSIKFSSNQARNASYIIDATGKTLIDNSTGLYAGKTVVLKAVNYNRTANAVVWSISIADDNSVLLRNTISSKQNIITDLSTIRSGASAGATAVQPSAISDMATQTWVGSQGYLTQHQSLSAYRTSAAQDVIDNNKENYSNKVTTLSSSSTNTQYPSAKCVYDMIGNIETLLSELR